MQVKRHESKKKIHTRKSTAKTMHYKIEKAGHGGRGKIGNGRQ